jgi:hypothetical protein
MDENIFLKDLAHFRLSSGSEIICEVLEWPDKENKSDIIVRDAMAILLGDYEGERLYVFKPWMHYIESANECFIINSDHVISTARPNEHLVRQYNYAVSEMHRGAELREESFKQEMEKNMKQLENLFSKFTVGDSDSLSSISNVVSFPNKDDKIH